ncbi:MAG: heavy metal translocating P-type ATPase [Ezakiella sp.]|nr:heavy metal translocating P-type ATPase [Ezakiella sp.]
MDMKNLNKKLNRFFKDYNNKLTLISGIFIAIGFIASRVFHQYAIRDIAYIIATILSGSEIIFRAIGALRFKVIGIELLVSIAIIGAFIIGEYTESAVVTFLFQFGSYLENRTLMKTRESIKILTEMAPQTALLINEDGSHSEVDVDEVNKGDMLLVKSGAMIAVDGIITSGDGYIDESSINGESMPRHKKKGDEVFAGTVLDGGLINMRASRVGEDTTFSKIIELVEEAQDAKSPAERFIDQFAKYYTPAVLVIAAIVFIITKNLELAITILVLGCPGALVIGAPVANVAGIGRAAKSHILLKGSESTINYAKTDAFLFDKTGTLTEGKSRVSDVIYFGDESEIDQLAASIENTSDHPLARAIVNHKDVDLITDIKSETIKGMGLKAMIDGKSVLAGNSKLMESEGVYINDKAKDKIISFQNKGASIVIIAIDKKLSAIYSIMDNIKPDAREMIKELKRLGIKKTVMLTGDSSRAAQAVAKEIGIDEVESELLPGEKLDIIKKYQNEYNYNVAFAGDGINDSPALAGADTGIAMASGTDVAIETSDVVLIKSDLNSLVQSLSIAKKTSRIMKQNIFIAIATVILLLIGLFRGYVHMGLGMLIHEASILVVILNAVRLIEFKSRD